MLISDRFKTAYLEKDSEELTVDEFLSKCKDDPSYYLSPAERMLKAIGEPELVDTHTTEGRLKRIHMGATIPVYKPFADFYGLERVIESVVNFFKFSAQGLEESKQILYLMGSVGGGKSSIAERLKALMEKEPFYAIKGSPIFESPLALFSKTEARELGIIDEYNIPERYFMDRPRSPWLTKRLTDHGGDITKFTVIKMYPSVAEQIAVTKVEPGDENNQDISSLVGKVSIRQLEHFDQNDTDAYNYSGGLCRANRGLMEFVEMFKAPIKILHPLITAVQEHNYNGTEALPAIPFDGIILAHSNEAEWLKFRNNKDNEAFIDRTCIIKVPYCLAYDDEINIYNKLLKNSAQKNADIAPHTLRTLAKWVVGTRLYSEGNKVGIKADVYNGEDILKKDPGTTKTYDQYLLEALEKNVVEGFSGISTRQAFKIIAKALHKDLHEQGATDPVLLMEVIRQQVIIEDFDEKRRKEWLTYLDNVIKPEYLELLAKDIHEAQEENYTVYAQNIFERYFRQANVWLQESNYIDPDTGIIYQPDKVEKELSELEQPSGITNAKDFRSEFVQFVLRYQVEHSNLPSWQSYRPMAQAIRKKLDGALEKMSPNMSLGKAKQANKKELEKYNSFFDNMMKKGYTRRQTERVYHFHESKGAV